MPRDPDKLAYVTQTTLSLDDTAGIVAALKRGSPPSSVRTRKTSATPPPTARRRSSVVAPQVDALVVVGAPNSSNSRRLQGSRRARRLPLFGAGAARRRHRLDAFGAYQALGVTAGASAPEVLVEEIFDAFAARYELSRRNRVGARRGPCFFPLPRAAAACTQIGGPRCRGRLHRRFRRRSARLSLPATISASCCPTRASPKASRTPTSSSTPAPAISS